MLRTGRYSVAACAMLVPDIAVRLAWHMFLIDACKPTQLHSSFTPAPYALSYTRVVASSSRGQDARRSLPRCSNGVTSRVSIYRGIVVLTAFAIVVGTVVIHGLTTDF